MKKSEKKTGYGVLAGAGFVLTLFFFGEIGMHYENAGSYRGVLIGFCLLCYGIAGWNRADAAERNERSSRDGNRTIHIDGTGHHAGGISAANEKCPS